MTTFQYRPPFQDAALLRIARTRGILSSNETMADGIARVSDALAAVHATLEPGDADAFRTATASALQSGRLGLSSQLFAAAGRTEQVAACTVLPVPAGSDGDRLRDLVAEAASASAAGMGCGIDLTSFDDPGDIVQRLNAALVVVHRALIARGQRPPAFMVTCDAAHPQIGGFIEAKADADFGAWVANLSVRFDGDKERFLELRDQIALAAHRNGEPGVLFGEPADADNPTPQYRMESTAPCAEVFMAAGERCVFVSVNLAAHVSVGSFDWPAFENSVALAVRIADNAVELAAVDAPPVVADRRRIGVGVCGLHTALLAMGVPYADSEPFAAQIAERLSFASHRESVALARRRGPFPAWSGSRWQDAAWISRKARHRAGAVSAQAWRGLERAILRDGVRNAVIVAFPPTGIVSELLGVSKSYEPHFDLRTHGGVLRPEVLATLAPGVVVDGDGQVVDADAGDLLACARQLPPQIHLDVHAAFCALSDEAGSKTVNLAADATHSDVIDLLCRARDLGLKGLTVFRDGCLAPVAPTACPSLGVVA